MAWLSLAAAARRGNVDRRTLEKRLRRGDGPPFIERGGRKWFSEAGIDAWRAARSASVPSSIRTDAVALGVGGFMLTYALCQAARGAGILSDDLLRQMIDGSMLALEQMGLGDRDRASAHATLRQMLDSGAAFPPIQPIPNVAFGEVRT